MHIRGRERDASSESLGFVERRALKSIGSGKRISVMSVRMLSVEKVRSWAYASRHCEPGSGDTCQ